MKQIFILLFSLKIYDSMAMMRMPCFRIIKITEVEDNANSCRMIVATTKNALHHCGMCQRSF